MTVWLARASRPPEFSTRIAGAINGHADVKGRPLAIYADLYAQDSTMGVCRSLHLAIAERAGLDHFIYTGTIIGGTRKFCHDNLGHTYTRAEIATMDNLSWHGKSAPPLTSCGGYNCRHHWQAMDPEWLDDPDPEEIQAALAQRNQPPAPEIPEVGEGDQS